MSLNIEQKKAVTAEVSKVFAESDEGVAVVAEYRGLTVSEMTQLRRLAKQEEVYLRVVKNTLVKRAAEGSKFECLRDELAGPLALAIGKDPVSVAKVMSDFAKGNEKFVIKASAMGGKLMAKNELDALATLPSREQLLATLVHTLQAPIATFARTLNEVPSKFVRSLAAVRDAKQG